MIDLNDQEVVNNILRVATQISLRYRNGFTLVGVNMGDGEAYLKALSAALTALGCKHLDTLLEAAIVNFKGKPSPVVTNNPSVHLFAKKPTVLAVPDITIDVPFFGAWLLSKRAKTVEVSTYRLRGGVPSWLNPDYVGVVESEDSAQT